MFTLSNMYGVQARRTCTPYMYDSVNTALVSMEDGWIAIGVNGIIFQD